MRLLARLYTTGRCQTLVREYELQHLMFHVNMACVHRASQSLEQ